MSSPNLTKLRINRNQTSEKIIQSRKGRTQKFILGGLSIILGFGLFSSYFSADQKITVTTVAIVYPSKKYTILNASGYVVPQRKASLSSKAQGRLEWLGVLEGSKVKKGEIIARLEKDDVEAAYRQALALHNVAEANLQQSYAELREAEQNLDRSKDLLEKKFISQAQYDASFSRLEKAKASIDALKASVRSATASIEAAKIAVKQTVITAPFDGVILTKTANVGDNITPFSSATDSKGAVVTIADMDTLEVEVDVSESNINLIKVDQPCEIILDAIPKNRFHGIVSRIVPTVDRSKATVLVKIRFDEFDERILPDMSAKVAFLEKKIPPNEKNPVMAILPSAVIEKESGHFVFIYDQGYVKEMRILLGEKIGEKIEVRKLSPGLEIINNPQRNLKDGMRVQKE